MTTSQMQYTSTTPTAMTNANATTSPTETASSSEATPHTVTAMPITTSVRRHRWNSRRVARSCESTGLVST